MKLRIIGLGRMGANMARRLAKNGHTVIAFNRTPEKAKALADEKPHSNAAMSLEELNSSLTGPRSVWVMVPVSNSTESTESMYEKAQSLS